ncbi:MAG TPA: hypothetical protein VF705_01170 [Longimicrobium sp.]
MKRLAFCALLATLGIAACDGGSPTTSTPTEVSRNLPPPDDGECCFGGGGGGGGGGTTTPPPAPQYRIQGQVYPIGSGPQAPTVAVKLRGWSRFEKLVGSEWVKVDASTLAVTCYAGGNSDHDDETNAGFTDVEFWTEPGQYGAPFTAQCTHTATYGGVTYSTTSTAYLQFI